VITRDTRKKEDRCDNFLNVTAIAKQQLLHAL